MSVGASNWQILNNKKTEKAILGNAVHGFSFVMYIGDTVESGASVGKLTTLGECVYKLWDYQ